MGKTKSTLTVKEQFSTAKALIDKKKYNEARELLRTITHPTAQKWLEKLDTIAPERKGKRKNGTADRKSNKLRPFTIFLTLLTCILIYAIGSNPALQQSRQADSSKTEIAQVATKDAHVETQTNVLTPPTAGPSVTPSTTITETMTPSPTTILPTATPTYAPPEIWYTISAANLRSCPETTCELVVQLVAGTAINIVGFEQGENYKGSDIWRRVDYGGHLVYVHSSLVAVNPPQPTSAPIQIVQPTSAPVILQPVVPEFVCPSNCDEAKARGMGAEEIAQKCPQLDRNHNGVACYGS